MNDFYCLGWTSVISTKTIWTTQTIPQRISCEFQGNVSSLSQILYILYFFLVKLRPSGPNNYQHCWANINCCVHIGSGVQRDATTPNNVAFWCLLLVPKPMFIVKIMYCVNCWRKVVFENTLTCVYLIIIHLNNLMHGNWKFLSASFIASCFFLCSPALH